MNLEISIIQAKTKSESAFADSSGGSVEYTLTLNR